MVGAQRVPYWQAGSAYAPWTAGYFGAFDIMPALFMGTMMGMAFSGGFDGGDNTDSGDSAEGGDGGDSGGDSGDSGDLSADGGGFDGGGDVGGGFGDFGGF